jgi:predicted lipoprotein with Yx(FWY)xxD motif
MNVRNLARSNLNRYQLRLLGIALVATIGLVAAGCGGGSSSSSAPKGGVAGAEHSDTSVASVAVTTRKISGLGVVLVNPKGRTLYVFMKDQRRQVTCTGSCASFWPPLKWKSSSKPTAGGAAKTSLLSSDKNPSGGRVVTYSKWPLYTYSGDSAAGQAKGEALNLSGGKWYVISAKGTLVTHRSSSGGGGTTTTGGGGWG